MCDTLPDTQSEEFINLYKKNSYMANYRHALRTPQHMYMYVHAICREVELTKQSAKILYSFCLMQKYKCMFIVQLFLGSLQKWYLKKP